jgi:hypothetical protein
MGFSVRDCKNCFWSTGPNYICVLQGAGPICINNHYPSWTSKYKCSYHDDTCSYTVENNGCLGETACSYCDKHNDPPLVNYKIQIDNRVEKIEEGIQQLKKVFS